MHPYYPIDTTLAAITAYNVQIDLSDEAKLRAARAQLKADLETVEFALRRFESAGKPKTVARKPRQLDLADEQEDLLAPTQSQRIRDAIAALPSRFTSSALYSQFDHAQRPSVKSVLRIMSKKGLIKLIRGGAGPNPSIYDKVSP